MIIASNPNNSYETKKSFTGFYNKIKPRNVIKTEKHNYDNYDNTFFFALTAAVLLTDLTTGFEAVTAGFLSW